MQDRSDHHDQLIPPPDLAPPSLKGTTMEQRIQMWCDLMDLSEQFLLAGLRRKIGPDGDLNEAYRQWYRQRMREHDQQVIDAFSSRAPEGS